MEWQLNGPPDQRHRGKKLQSIPTLSGPAASRPLIASSSKTGALSNDLPALHPDARCGNLTRCLVDLDTKQRQLGLERVDKVTHELRGRDVPFLSCSIELASAMGI